MTIARVRRGASCSFDVDVLSSCKLSITACFCAAVIVEACCAESLSGVAGDGTATVRVAIVLRKIDESIWIVYTSLCQRSRGGSRCVAVLVHGMMCLLLSLNIDLRE